MIIMGSDNTVRTRDESSLGLIVIEPTTTLDKNVPDKTPHDDVEDDPYHNLPDDDSPAHSDTDGHKHPGKRK